MTTKNTTRADIATTIHKAVRKILFDHAVLLGRTDFANVEECRSAHAETVRAFRALREHADHEDEIVLPELASGDPDLAAEATRQHEDLENQMRNIERLASLAVVATPNERADVGRRLRDAVYGFVAQQLTHLSFEENVVMPALWRTHTDEQLYGMQARMRARIPPERGLEWRDFLLASIDAGERAGFGA